jgi:hypothetical protein
LGSDAVWRLGGSHSARPLSKRQLGQLATSLRSDRDSGECCQAWPHPRQALQPLELIQINEKFRIDASMYLSGQGDSHMQVSVRFPSYRELDDTLIRERRDVAVMQAITNVTDRQPWEGWWELRPGGRTRAIYDEVKRLDQARMNDTAALAVRDDLARPSHSVSTPYSVTTTRLSAVVSL